MTKTEPPTVLRCVDCGVEMTGRRDRQRCSTCRHRHVNRKTRRNLRPGEALPPGEPTRYRRPDGYVLLRWKVGPRSYVETYEHRVDDDRVVDAEHVHHLNLNRSDNRPENLEHVTKRQHEAMHAEIGWWPKAAALYAEGASTVKIGAVLGYHPSTVLRALRKMEIPIDRVGRR